MGEGSPRLRLATGLNALVNLCRFNNDWAGLVREGTVHEITGLIGAFEIEPVIDLRCSKLPT